jgi:hypothetical protein
LISGWDDGKIRAFYPETGRIKFVIPEAHSDKVEYVKVLYSRSTLLLSSLHAFMWIFTAVYLWLVASIMRVLMYFTIPLWRIVTPLSTPLLLSPSQSTLT